MPNETAGVRYDDAGLQHLAASVAADGGLPVLGNQRRQALVARQLLPRHTFSHPTFEGEMKATAEVKV